MNKNLISLSLVLVLCVIAVFSAKPGSCPAATGVGICIQGCNIDEECSGTKKCVIYNFFS